MVSVRSWPLSKDLAEVREGADRPQRTSSDAVLRREHIGLGSSSRGKGEGTEGQQRSHRGQTATGPPCRPA